MRRFLILGLSALSFLAACGGDFDDNVNDCNDEDCEETEDNGGYTGSSSSGTPGCAPAPSGSGSWENWADDGLHCNYYHDSRDEWGYYPNSSESGCLKASWAPSQSSGNLVLWVDDQTNNRGCDWVLD